MAHFAELDENDIVKRVIVINNKDILDEDKNENEEIGIAFCKNIFGQFTNWIQTSYNGKFRKNYASKGFKYDKTFDAFISPTPFPSWILDETTCKWKAPIPDPNTEDDHYTWNETSLKWIEVPTIPNMIKRK
jgi:hypothetical protein